MRTPFLTSITVMTVLAAVMYGQTRGPARTPPAAAGGMPRTSDGHPDLQGTYDLGTHHAARATRRHAAGADRRRGEEARTAGRGSQRETQRADRRQPRRAAVGRRRIAGPVRQRRRLQQFLAGSRLALHHRRRSQARLADCRSAGRPRSGADRDGAERATPRGVLRTTSDEAIREDDPGLRRRRRLRRSGTASARRALHHRLQLDVGPADPADLLLQQPASDRADARTRS